MQTPRVQDMKPLIEAAVRRVSDENERRERERQVSLSRMTLIARARVAMTCRGLRLDDAD